MSGGLPQSGGTEPRRSRRLRFPLWLRFGLLFGGLMSGMLAATGLLDLQDERARASDELRQRQEGLAVALASAIDGEVVDAWSSQADSQRDDYQQIRRNLREGWKAAEVSWVGIYGRSDDRAFYLLDSSDKDPLAYRFPYFDMSPQMERAFDGEPSFAVGVKDEWGRWDCAYAPVKAGSGHVVGVLSVEVDSAWREAFTKRKMRQVIWRAVAASAVAFLVALLLARTLVRRIETLAQAARRVARGEFDQHVEMRTHDEVGDLAQAFNQMVKAVRERNLMRDAFGRYVSPELAQQLLADPTALKPGGQERRLTVLMSDLRGFSALSRRLSPARMVPLLNAYLERMGEVIDAHNGSVNEYFGDGILALFGAHGESPDDALRAVRCAVAMQRALEDFNEELERKGLSRLEMGIGLNTGTVIVGNIGSSHHAKWGVVGDAVNMAARVETFTVGGEVLLTEETLAEAGELVVTRGPIEVRVKGALDALKLHAVLSLRDAIDEVVPGEVRAVADFVPVELEAGVARIVDKQVLPSRLRARIVALGTRGATVCLSGELAVFDDLCLRILLPDGPIEEVYAKVVAAEEATPDADAGGGVSEGAEHRAIIRFTSVPPDGRRRLAALTERERPH